MTRFFGMHWFRCIHLLRLLLLLVLLLLLLLLLQLLLLLKLLHLHLHLLKHGLILCTITLQLLLVLDPIDVVDDHLLLRVHDLLSEHGGLRWVPNLLQVYFLTDLTALSFCLGACSVVRVHVRGGLTLRGACDSDSWLLGTT